MLRPSLPFETFLDYLQEQNISIHQAISQLGLDAREFKLYLRGWSYNAKLALQLEALTGIPKEFWQKRNSNYQMQVSSDSSGDPIVKLKALTQVFQAILYWEQHMEQKPTPLEIYMYQIHKKILSLWEELLQEAFPYCQIEPAGTTLYTAFQHTITPLWKDISVEGWELNSFENKLLHNLDLGNYRVQAWIDESGSVNVFVVKYDEQKNN